MAFSVEYEDLIIRARFYGSLSGADLVNCMAQVDALEEQFTEMPSRITDIADVVELRIDFDDILSLASLRRTKRFPNRFKSALVAVNESQTGFARMFQTLNTNPQIDIRIFSDSGSALAWIASEL